MVKLGILEGRNDGYVYPTASTVTPVRAARDIVIGRRLSALLTRTGRLDRRAIKSLADEMRANGRIRAKMLPDFLLRRRASGEPLRLLARDYQVTHTSLGRYFGRPAVASELKQTERLLRAEAKAACARRRGEPQSAEQTDRQRLAQPAAGASEREQASRERAPTVGLVQLSLQAAPTRGVARPHVLYELPQGSTLVPVVAEPDGGVR